VPASDDLSWPSLKAKLEAQEDVWKDLFEKLRAEATKQTSLIASKTEELLAAADQQLAELLSKAETLIQKSAVQVEERLAKRSGHLLREMKTRLRGSGHMESPKPRELQASPSAPLNIEDRGCRAPQQIFQHRSGKAAEVPSPFDASVPIRQPMDLNHELTVEPLTAISEADGSPMQTLTGVAELMAKLNRTGS